VIYKFTGAKDRTMTNYLLKQLEQLTQTHWAVYSSNLGSITQATWAAYSSNLGSITQTPWV